MRFRILVGDVLDRLKQLPDESVHCVVTSPPYWGPRDYGHEGQIGLEPTPAEFVAKLVEVFREVRRVLRPEGTCWVNMGDSYAGSWGAQSREHAGKHAPNFSALSANQIKAAQIRTKTGSSERTPGLKPKDLCGIPWRLAFALQDDGWWLRQDIIWAKPNPMPESVTDRCTKAHEYIFLLSKSERYHYDAEAIKEPAAWAGYTNSFGNKNAEARGVENLTGNMAEGVRYTSPDMRNRRSVWTVGTEPFKEAHFATFPTELVKPCILAGCPEDGTVLDPFNGAGTTGLVAQRLGRNYIGIELNPEYAAMSERRIRGDCPMFSEGGIEASA